MATVRTRSQGVKVTMDDGSVYTIRNLTAPGRSNAKLRKNTGYLTLGLSLAPDRSGGIGNLCTYASKGCIRLCLHISGRSDGENALSAGILRARQARARYYYQDRAQFLARLIIEIWRERIKARRQGLTLIVRLNVISDIDWARLHPEVINAFPDVQFYGYTKNPRAMERYLNGVYPSNYHLTFSRSETNEAQALEFLTQGANVAVVFDTKYTAGMKRPLPAEWNGHRVIDGDETDLRFLDPRGVVVGLRAKGRARKAGFVTEGFVVKTDRHPVAPRVILN